jgi:hypothetical protein
MLKLSPNNCFRLKWLGIAITVFAASYFLGARDRHFSKQWAQPEKAAYTPFIVRHFTIAINPDNYDFLFSDKPESLYSYQNAELLIDHQPIVYKSRFRIRGTHSWNWDPRKPSFRIRQAGKRKILARSNLNFILPDDACMLANLIADHIAEKWSIPSPRTVPATVTLNGEYKGLYHLAEPLNPETAADQGFAEHDVIEGNLRNSRMWNRPELWEIHFPQDSSPEPARAALKKMLQLCATPVNPEKASELTSVLDIGRVASWSALMTAIGSIHTNDFFGNVMLFDRNRHRLFPAIDDSSGFGVQTTAFSADASENIQIPPYEFLTPLQNALFRIPEFQFCRNLALYRLLLNELSEEALAGLVEKYMQLLDPFIDKEPFASALINVPILNFPQKIPVSPHTQRQDAERLKSFMKERRAFLLHLLTEARAAISETRTFSTINGSSYRHIVLQVSGHCPVEFDLSDWKSIILADVDFDGVPDPAIRDFYSLQRFYPGLREDNSPQPQYLQISQRSAGFILTDSPQNYVLGIKNDNYRQAVEFLLHQGLNSITGNKTSLLLNPEIKDPATIRPNHFVIHSWKKYHDKN